MTQLIDLQKHCYRLSYLIAELPPETRGNLSWLSASDWLNTAAGIEEVIISTHRYDQSVMYCGSAWDYEAKRSNLLTIVGTHLTIFNFVWGGFETVIKMIAPPFVPNSVKKRRTIIDDALLFLKNEYEPTPPVALYNQVLANLRSSIKQHPSYDLEQAFKLSDYIGLSGVGTHIVRIIRNDFAHGSAQLPEPHDWESTKILKSELPYIELMKTSSRIILLTIQMLLIAHLKKQKVEVTDLADEEGMYYEVDVHPYLNKFHLQNQQDMNEYQAPLFHMD